MGLGGQLHTPPPLTTVPAEYKVGWAPKSIWKLRKKEKFPASAWNRKMFVDIVACFIVTDHAILSNKG